MKAVRADLGQSQSEFALMMGVSVATLRNWEQGRRMPDGPALALGAGAEGNRYRVDVTVERLKRTGAAGLALRVLDGLGTLIRQERGSGDRVVVTFDRNVAAKATQTDYFALDWVGDARGEFQLRVAVTDLQTNRVSSRDTRCRIR